MAHINLIKKTNDPPLYINRSSNHPFKIINQLPKIICNRLPRNSSHEEVLSASKGEYEHALKHSGYNNCILSFHQLSTSHANDKVTITSYGLTHLIVAQSLQILQRISFNS